MSCITITFGDVAENHVGIQKIGTPSEITSELEDFGEIVERIGDQRKVEIVDLGETYVGSYVGSVAHVLVVRDGVSLFTDKNCFDDLVDLDWDRKFLNRGKVMNKVARWNLCFSETSQEPSYDEGKGRIVSFDTIDCLKTIRENLPTYLGEKARNLVAEGNYYYDTSKCGIGFHGDTERRIVIGFRFGESMNLLYRWYQNSIPISDVKEIILNDGDFYIMSGKAVGSDWKKRKIATLRHAAGSRKYTKVD